MSRMMHAMLGFLLLVLPVCLLLLFLLECVLELSFFMDYSFMRIVHRVSAVDVNWFSAVNSMRAMAGMSVMRMVWILKFLVVRCFMLPMGVLALLHVLELFLEFMHMSNGCLFIMVGLVFIIAMGRWCVRCVSCRREMVLLFI